MSPKVPRGVAKLLDLEDEELVERLRAAVDAAGTPTPWVRGFVGGLGARVAESEPLTGPQREKAARLVVRCRDQGRGRLEVVRSGEALILRFRSRADRALVEACLAEQRGLWVAVADQRDGRVADPGALERARRLGEALWGAEAPEEPEPAPTQPRAPRRPSRRSGPQGAGGEGFASTQNSPEEEGQLECCPHLPAGPEDLIVEEVRRSEAVRARFNQALHDRLEAARRGIQDDVGRELIGPEPDAPCACGDVFDEHGRDPAHPGSTACTVEGCGCVAFEGGR